MSHSLGKYLLILIAAPNSPALFHIQVAQLLYFGVNSRSFYRSNLWCPLAQWSGFKNLKNITIIYKPDQLKNKTFIVPPPCIFSAFCNFNFQLVQVVAHFLVLKMSRNLSKFLKAEKVQSVPNQTCAGFDSFLETLHVWFKYFSS